MKKNFLFSAVLLSGLFYAQTISKTLINNNLDNLFINKDNPFGKIPVKTVDKYLTENSKLYFFEIIYNNKVLFREAIKKTIPQSTDSEIMSSQFRLTYDRIYIDAQEITDSDKLRLLESYKNKIVDIAGKKLIELKDYQIIEKDYSKRKFVIKDPLDNMKIMIYQLDFN